MRPVPDSEMLIFNMNFDMIAKASKIAAWAIKNSRHSNLANALEIDWARGTECNLQEDEDPMGDEDTQRPEKPMCSCWHMHL